MGMIKDQVLKALSTALNTSVTCDELDVAMLRGAVEVKNLRIAAGAGDEPIVTIARATGKLSLTKALGGTIAITEFNVEGMSIHVARDASGDWNFPKKRISFAKPESATQPTTAPAKKKTVEVDKALLVNSTITFSYAMKDGSAYVLRAAPVMANIAKRAGGYDVTFIVDTIRRADTGDALGACKVAATLDGGTDLTQVPTMSLNLKADLDTRAHAMVTTTSLKAGPYAFDAKADVDLATLKTAVPKALLERVPQVTGQIALAADGAFDQKTGLRLNGAKISVGASEVKFS